MGSSIVFESKPSGSAGAKNSPINDIEVEFRTQDSTASIFTLEADDGTKYEANFSDGIPFHVTVKSINPLSGN